MLHINGSAYGPTGVIFLWNAIRSQLRKLDVCSSFMVHWCDSLCGPVSSKISRQRVGQVPLLHPNPQTHLGSFCLQPPPPGFNPTGGSTQSPSLSSTPDLPVSSSQPSCVMGKHLSVTSYLVPSSVVHLCKANPSPPALAPIEPTDPISPREAGSADKTPTDENRHCYL